MGTHGGRFTSPVEIRGALGADTRVVDVDDVIHGATV